MKYPDKNTQVYVIMKSGAVYHGIYQRHKECGGGSIQLSDVKIVDRNNYKNWIVSPKHKISRWFWVSKIDSIVCKDGI